MIDFTTKHYRTLFIQYQNLLNIVVFFGVLFFFKEYFSPLTVITVFMHPLQANKETGRQLGTRALSDAHVEDCSVSVLWGSDD